MNRVRVRADLLVFLCLLAAATLLRLGELDRLPLDQDEATLALQAAETTMHASAYWDEDGSKTTVSSLYQTGTSVIFSFVGTSTVSARMLPALAGIALVCLPYLFRRKLGVWRALLLMACLTLSPTLVTVSRSADETNFTVLGLTLALLLIWNRDGSWSPAIDTWSALGLGIAFVAGPSFLDGAFTIVVGCTLLLILRGATIPQFIRSMRLNWSRKQALLTLVVVLFLAGGFGFMLENLSTIGETLTVWLRAWRQPGMIHPVSSLFMLAAYAPFGLVFGVLGSVAAFRRRDAASMLAACFALGGVLLLVLYPARAGRQLVWVVVPLLFIASTYLETLIGQITQQRNWLEFLGVVLAILILMIFSYLQIAAYAAGVGPVIDPLDAGLRLMMAGGILFMAGLVVVLFGLGWSWRLSLDALGAAGGLALFALTVMSIWRLNFNATAVGSSELWRPRAPAPSLSLLVESIESLSQASTGREDSLPLKVFGSAPPELAWALRAFEEPSNAVAADQNPEPLLLFKEVEGQPQLFADYTGQGFDTIQRWAWRGPVPPDPVRWWVRRSLPVTGEHWVLLVRLDIAALGESIEPAAGAP